MASQPGETDKVRLHNGPRHEEISIKANYDIAASASRIRFSLTADEIFNAKQSHRDSSAFSVR